MTSTPAEDGLRVVDLDVDVTDESDGDLKEADPSEQASGHFAPTDLESLRDEFVDGFNARDLDAVLRLVRDDVETPDIAGDGAPVLAEELQSIWERSPGAILTRGFLDEAPVAVAWLPDEDGCWSRAALVCFDADSDLLSVVALPDDPDALDRAQADDPTGEDQEEWSDWSEWDRGEETVARPRDRSRP